MENTTKIDGLSIIIPAFNRFDRTVECIESLLLQKTPPGCRYEIIVVDNNSTDNTYNRIKEKFSPTELKLIFEPKPGVSAARNAGARVAEFNYIFFIDNDIILDKDGLNLLFDYIKTTEDDVIAAAGIIRPRYTYKPPFWYSDSFETRSFGDIERKLENCDLNAGIPGGFCVYKKATFWEAGGFDVDRGVSGHQMKCGEESDLMAKILQQPKNKNSNVVFLPFLTCKHYVEPHELSIKYRIRRSFFFGRSVKKNKKSLLLLPVQFLMPLVDTFSWFLKTKSRVKEKFSTRLVIILSQFVWYCGYHWRSE